MQAFLKVFFSRPNSLKDEQRVMREVVARLNSTKGAGAPHSELKLYQWDDFAGGTPAAHKPLLKAPAQDIINKDGIADAAIYVGIMGDYYGQGTADEFEYAVSHLRQFGRPQVLFYMKSVSFEATRTHFEQFTKLAAFSEKVWKSGIQRKYTSDEELAALLEKDLRWAAGGIQRTRYLLTSLSPRRIKLMRQLGLSQETHFTAHPVSTESLSGRRSEAEAREEAQKMAVGKVEKYRLAHRTSQRDDRAVVIGADTIVWCDGSIQDQPLIVERLIANAGALADARMRAEAMLMHQSGKEVLVITGIAVAPSELMRAPVSTVVTTRARMRQFSKDEVRAYLDAAPDAITRAGAVSLDDRGVALFEGITEGSFSNVAGLPLKELVECVRKIEGLEAERFYLPRLTADTSKPDDKRGLSVLSVGDINFDLVCHELPPGSLRNVKPPGIKLISKIERRLGGTAVNFSRRAKEAGFACASVVGVVGTDPFGSFVQSELHEAGIESLFSAPNIKTSIALIIREASGVGGMKSEDVSITLTDAYQYLPKDFANQHKPRIVSQDVVYVSGYAICDSDRQDAAKDILAVAHKDGVTTILDVVVGMDSAWKDEFDDKSFQSFLRWLGSRPKNQDTTVDVLVSETAEMLRWVLGDAAEGHQHDQAFVEDVLLPKLTPHFRVIVLRTPNYSWEMVAARGQSVKFTDLDYQSLKSTSRFAYGDQRTARLAYEFLSPRILLASSSKQRRSLLEQIVHRDKFITFRPSVPEDMIPDESPRDRVLRLSRLKAEEGYASLAQHDKGGTIEFIVGADTQAYLVHEDGTEEVLAHPTTDAESKEILSKLKARTHYMTTGVTVIGVNLATGKKEQASIEEVTEVRFGDLSDEDIDSYVYSQEPLNKAGGYGIQGFAEVFVENLKGSYSNVVGLPLEKLAQLLQDRFGMSVWSINKHSGWRLPQSLLKLKSLN